MFGVADTVDFNQLDPKSLTFNPDANAVLYEGRLLIASIRPIDVARVERGWALIYSDYCTGISKRF